MNLLSVESKITPLQDKTNINHAFTVPEGIKSIRVEYEYSPKIVEDRELAGNAIVDGLRRYKLEVVDVNSFLPVKNLITLSFDEAGEYRGACHRQPNRQTIIIAPSDSTPGIFNRPIKSGVWQAVLNVHYIGCDVDYTLKVEGEE